jgi:hypothetical protein
MPKFPLIVLNILPGSAPINGAAKIPDII